MTPSVVRLAVRRTAFALAPLLVACGGGDGPTPPPPAPSVARLDVADPLPTSATVGTTFNPTVRAFDAQNRTVAGATLRFTSARGTTTIAQATAVTGANGVAAPGAWTLGTKTTVDTLIVTVEGATGVAPLRIPMAVNAGPVARWQALAPTSGNGTLLASMLSGPAFQLFDQYDNPAASVPVTVVITPENGARTPLTADSDAQGIVLLNEWVPRVLGAHTLQFTTQSGNTTLTSPVLTRTVSQPACAPTKGLPSPFWNAENVVVSRTGTVTPTAVGGCTGAPDIWAFGTDSARAITVDARVGTSTTPLVFSVVRAGVAGPAGIVVPEILGRTSGCTPTNAACGIPAFVPPGEYEVRVGTAATAQTAYTLQFANRQQTADFSTQPAWLARGVDMVESHGGPGDGVNYDLPGTPVPVAFGRLYQVSMRDPARRTLLVELDIRGNVQDPRIIVYGRTSPTATPVYLGTGTTTFPQRNAQLEIPAEYVDALVYIVMERRAPTSQFLLEYRLRVN